MRYLQTLIILIVLLLACNKQPESTQSSNVTSDGVINAEMFSNLLNTNQQLIDVRTPEEFQAGYIPNAKNINFRGDNFENQMMTLDPQKPVLIYCKSGGRSGKTYSLLKNKGFNIVYDLEGGFTAWSNAKKPVSK